MGVARRDSKRESSASGMCKKVNLSNAERVGQNENVVRVCPPSPRKSSAERRSSRMQNHEPMSSAKTRQIAQVLRASAWPARKHDGWLACRDTHLGNGEGQIQMINTHDSQPATRRDPAPRRSSHRNYNT